MTLKKPAICIAYHLNLSRYLPTCQNQTVSIIIESFQQGNFPDNLKVVIWSLQSTKVIQKYYVQTIHPDLPFQYLGKILEKSTKDCQFTSISIYNRLYDHQFGFQKGKLTKDAVLDLYVNIIKATEKHEKTCVIFLDFAKAFDTMKHDTLLRQLKHYIKKRGLVRRV